TDNRGIGGIGGMTAVSKRQRVENEKYAEENHTSHQNWKLDQTTEGAPPGHKNCEVGGGAIRSSVTIF
ncbi:hypothetical protein U1Q18_014132, partial [Sarracenia purpurea var. burkii]